MKQTLAPVSLALILWGFSILMAYNSGCTTSQPYVIHAGSIAVGNDGGAFDSHTADFLSEERAFLDSFKGKA